jgi:hypothetical protein
VNLEELQVTSNVRSYLNNVQKLSFPLNEYRKTKNLSIVPLGVATMHHIMPGHKKKEIANGKKSFCCGRRIGM